MDDILRKARESENIRRNYPGGLPELTRKKERGEMRYRDMKCITCEGCGNYERREFQGIIGPVRARPYCRWWEEFLDDVEQDPATFYCAAWEKGEGDA